MQPSVALRRNALSGIRRLDPAEPILPFLYNTQTIRRQHTDALSDFEDSLEYKPRAPQRPQRDGERKSAPRSGGRKEGRAQYERRGQRFGSASERPVEHDAVDSLNGALETSSNQYRRPHREEHVPFEHADQETKSIGERIAGSTMTPSEKKAFQELLSLPQRKGSKKREGRDKLEDVLNKAMRQRKKPDAKPMPEVLKQMQEHLKEDRNAAQRVLLDQAVEMDLKQVQEALDAAQTDVELWKVLHERVLSRVTSLGLDRPHPQSSKQQKQTPKVENEIPKAEMTQLKWPGNTPDQLVIAETFPQHLVRCQRILMYDFPASELGGSLLPYLKRLGPTTFALAASTKLYNNHMRIARTARNFPLIMHTLEEMDKEVYEFDDKTQDSVNWIYQRSRAARTGIYGAGVAALWNGERFRKAINTTGRWNALISERMQEKALREARAKEEEEGKQAAVY